MKITTWNVNGVRAREAQVVDWLRAEKPDVLCLQELKATYAQVPTSLMQLPGYHAYWHGNAGGYSGVSLHVREGFVPHRPVFSHPEFDLEGRIVTASLGSLELASIYVPNGGKDLPSKIRFLEALELYVARSHAAGKLLVLCGDLNVALTTHDVHPKLADEKLLGQTPAERELLAKILNQSLVDLLRHFDPDNKDLFTWWAPWRSQRERNIGWRLDYVLASKALANQARSCRCERLFGSSDHAPVTAVFEGSLFDAAAVAKGPAQTEPAALTTAGVGAPQLDLFGRR